MPFQRSFAPSQVSAREESIQASTLSQSMGPLRPPCLKNQSCTFPGLLVVLEERRARPANWRLAPTNHCRGCGPPAQSLAPAMPAARVERCWRPFWPIFRPLRRAQLGAGGSCKARARPERRASPCRLAIGEFELDAAVAAQYVLGETVLERLELAVAGGNQAFWGDAAADQVFHDRGRARAR